MMRLLPRLAPGLLAVVLTAAAAPFEGKVHMDMTSGRDKVPIIYAIKGDKARSEMPSVGAGMASIIDGTKQEMVMLMPEQRMYMVMSLQDAAETAQKATGASNVTFEDTGETETILGRECRKYRVTDRETTTEVWATQGMGSFMGQMGGGGGRNPMKREPVPGWQRELMAKGFFPLRIVGKNRRGKETYRMDVTKIDETSLPDALFQVPEGYQRFDMGGMMRGLIPGMK